MASAIGSVSIDDLWEARDVRGEYTQSAAPTSAHSSIQKSTIEPAAPTLRPVLSEPVHIMEDLLGSYSETERLTSSLTKLFKAEVEEQTAEIQKLSAERMEALAKSAREAESRATWSTLSDVSQYIMGVGTIVLGAVCGGVPGALLVGSGVIGLSMRVAQDTHLLQGAVEWYTKSEELQKTITQRIEMGAFCLQLGLGIAGGVGVWKAGTLAAAQANGADKLRSILTGASSIMGVGGKVGTAYHDKHIAYLQAKMKEIDTTVKLKNLHITQEATQLGGMVEGLDSSAQVLQGAMH